jgi:hypothetical protein
MMNAPSSPLERTTQKRRAQSALDLENRPSPQKQSRGYMFVVRGTFGFGLAAFATCGGVKKAGKLIRSSFLATVHVSEGLETQVELASRSGFWHSVCS